MPLKFLCPYLIFLFTNKDYSEADVVKLKRPSRASLPGVQKALRSIRFHRMRELPPRERKSREAVLSARLTSLSSSVGPYNATNM